MRLSITASMSDCRALWLKILVEGLKIMTEESMLLMVDNKPLINLAKNPVADGRTNIFRPNSIF